VQTPTLESHEGEPRLRSKRGASKKNRAPHQTGPEGLSGSEKRYLFFFLAGFFTFLAAFFLGAAFFAFLAGAFLAAAFLGLGAAFFAAGLGAGAFFAGAGASSGSSSPIISSSSSVSTKPSPSSPSSSSSSGDSSVSSSKLSFSKSIPSSPGGILPDVSGLPLPPYAARAAKPLTRSYRIQQAMSRILRRTRPVGAGLICHGSHNSVQGDFCAPPSDAAVLMPVLFFFEETRLRAGRASGAPPMVYTRRTMP